jgi:alpha-D-xyloside xylohydrolase
MAESLRGGLSLTMCGFGYWSHDIGGFESKASAAAYKRWVAFGLMSSHSRLHGSTSYRVPWLYDEEAVDVVRHFTRVKCQLMPYLMHASLQAHQKNTPMMRAMVLEHAEDPTCRTLDRQYYLGDSLLVAPVFHEKRAEYYLPQGNWTHLTSGEVREGGRWFFDEQSFFELPVWVKENSAIALGDQTEQVDYPLDNNLCLLLGKLDGQTPIDVGVNSAAGEALTSFTVTQAGNQLTIENSRGRSDFSVRLPWATEVNDIQGGAQSTPSADGGFASTGVLVRATAARLSFSWR